MRIGELRETILIQQPDGEPDAYGNPTANAWETVFTRRASVKSLSGREYLQTAESKNTVTHTITIHYTDGITPRMRVLWRNRVLNIAPPLIHDKLNHRWTQLKCVEEL